MSDLLKQPRLVLQQRAFHKSSVHLTYCSECPVIFSVNQANRKPVSRTGQIIITPNHLRSNMRRYFGFDILHFSTALPSKLKIITLNCRYPVIMSLHSSVPLSHYVHYSSEHTISNLTLQSYKQGYKQSSFPEWEVNLSPSLPLNKVGSFHDWKWI